MIRERLKAPPHRLVCQAVNSGQPCAQRLSGMAMAAGRNCTGDGLFWSHSLKPMGGTVAFDAEVISGFRCHERSTRSNASRSQERLRFAAYASAIAAVLQLTRPKPA